MSPYPATPQRGHLYWAQVPYLPERPLDVLRRMAGGEVRAALTFKTRPVLVVQNRRDNANPVYPFVLVAAVHSIKPGELEKLRRINHPTDFLLSPAECGLKRPSVVFLNQLLTIHKNLLQDHIGSLSAPKLAELNVKLALALSLVES
jgi:mRNA interferase MazF